MTGHESIHELLPLAVAGALEADEQRRLDAHVRECPECARDLEVWSAYAQAMRRLPQPAVPPQLTERTRARIWRERAAAADRMWNDFTLVALALFAWTVGLTFWFLLRVFTGGALVFMGANLVRIGAWSAISTILVWLTAAVAALALGKRRRQLRSVL